jgi:hypothetical protein
MTAIVTLNISELERYLCLPSGMKIKSVTHALERYGRIEMVVTGVGPDYPEGSPLFRIPIQEVLKEGRHAAEIAP